MFLYKYIEQNELENKKYSRYKWDPSLFTNDKIALFPTNNIHFRTLIGYKTENRMNFLRDFKPRESYMGTRPVHRLSQ